ncbi:serine hydrolase [Mesorhizobium sp. SB112]|uniref:serine hydrolase domain-containing protein n=1 Tax=Mesorhizobium sp. SB112 TaxID=3151853 RepID=UPI0032672BF5
MKFLLKILKWTAGLVVLAVVALVAWLGFFPPDLIRVGSGYSAKIVCSNVFLAGRNPKDVLEVDVQAPGHPLLRLMSVDVDEGTGTVTAGLFGLLGKSVAIYREGLGCTSFPNGPADVDRVVTGPLVEAAQGEGMWPDGGQVPPPSPEIAAILNDSQLAGPGMRAIVVVRDGQIVGEKYADGFSDKTRLLGWSMTKTVNAALIGTAVKAGKMNIESGGLFPAWNADGRSAINVDSLMGMSSGLEFNEDYGDVTDVTRMLFLESDMARFAETKPLAGEAGKLFNYSSGTTVMLSRLWQDAVGTDQAVDWPKDSLFSPIGMNNAVMEMDAAGTYVGSSYLYATARDWARFGQFLLQDGTWKGAEILPEGFVSWMRQAALASDGWYGRGQLWLKGPARGDTDTNPDKRFGLPADTYWMLGHDGQSAAIIPSKGLVIVRLGLTPSKFGYQPQGLVWAVVKASE